VELAPGMLQRARLNAPGAAHTTSAFIAGPLVDR